MGLCMVPDASVIEQIGPVAFVTRVCLHGAMSHIGKLLAAVLLLLGLAVPVSGATNGQTALLLHVDGAI
ncbi:MAG: hypothetical protein ACRESO_08630, partial [Gammaproteobacteria bacterium]